MIYTEINITGLEEIKARVRELADLTERMHVALGKLENCKINIEAGIDGLSPMESSQVKSNNQTQLRFWHYLVSGGLRNLLRAWWLRASWS